MWAVLILSSQAGDCMMISWLIMVVLTRHLWGIDQKDLTDYYIVVVSCCIYPGAGFQNGMGGVFSFVVVQASCNPLI